MKQNAKTKRTVHVTVTVPRALRKKMDDLQERKGNVNWSLVARRAFRKHIQKNVEEYI